MKKTNFLIALFCATTIATNLFASDNSDNQEQFERFRSVRCTLTIDDKVINFGNVGYLNMQKEDLIEVNGKWVKQEGKPVFERDEYEIRPHAYVHTRRHIENHEDPSTAPVYRTHFTGIDLIKKRVKFTKDPTTGKAIRNVIRKNVGAAQMHTPNAEYGSSLRVYDSSAPDTYATCQFSTEEQEELKSE